MIFPREGDLAVLERFQSVVRDRHAMGVPGEVPHHLLRAAKRRLGVDNPVVFATPVEVVLEGCLFQQWAEIAIQNEAALVPGLLQQIHELASEDSTEDSHGEKEASAARDPVRLIVRHAAARDHTVNMGVEVEVLAPGMKDGEETNLSAKVLRVLGYQKQGLGRGAEQDVEENSPILQR
jgi:hypothetical protein